MTHLPLDELGDVDAAARDPHVLACERCRQAVAEQQSVRALLAALPAPAVAPPDVVRALEATLARLRQDAAPTAAEPTPTDSPADATPAVTVVPMSSAPSRRGARWRERAPGLLAAAAAVVLAVGLGGLLLRGGGDSGSASSAGASAELRTGAADGTALVAASTGTAYTKAKLATQVEALLAGRSTSSAAPAAPRGLLAAPTGLRGCLSAIGATGAPLAIDLATFDGTPAAIFVLPATGGGREVWVVAPDCRPGADGTRYFTRLP